MCDIDRKVFLKIVFNFIYFVNPISGRGVVFIHPSDFS